MKEEEIIEAMVKGRECCRNFVQCCEMARQSDFDNQGSKPDGVDQSTIAGAHRAVTRMLVYFKLIPGRPVEHVKTNANRQYVTGLLEEIRCLMDRAMILEREIRRLKIRKNGRTPENIPSERVADTKPGQPPRYDFRKQFAAGQGAMALKLAG